MHKIFPRKGYLIAKIYTNTNREPTNLGMTIMEKMQNMKSPTKTPSPRTPSPQIGGKRKRAATSPRKNINKR